MRVSGYIIENAEGLAWSNTYGWVEDAFDTFSPGERESLNLPIGGHWVAVPWLTEE